MHVLVVTVVHHPQDARILHRQIRALREAGHTITYAAPWLDTGAEPAAAEGLQVVDLPCARGRRRVRALRAARALIRRLGREADLILLHDPELLAAVAGLRLPVTVWDVHEDTAAALSDKPWLPPPARRPARRLVRCAERAAERRLRLLLAETHYQERFRRPHPVVPNETTVPDTVAGPGADRVVYLGRLSVGRGAGELLALPALLPSGVRLELFGPADDTVAADVAAAHKRGLLRWHGIVPNDRAVPALQGALAGLSLLCDEANYRHSRPTKIVEYMACGVPAITTPNPVAADLVSRHGCGLVVPFDDPAAVAAALRRLHGDPGLRRDLGRRGHRAAQRDYDWRCSGRAFVAQLEAWAGLP
ncbi:MAG: glycosyltransferase [Nitriliruptorales bacterium]|nr:glycosyltransferase [Nitriliruptorales bacterium]